MFVGSNQYIVWKILGQELFVIKGLTRGLFIKLKLNFYRKFIDYLSSGSIGSGAKTSLFPALFMALTIPLASMSSIIRAARL